MKIKNNTSKGYLEAQHGDGIDLGYPNSTTRRGRVQKGMSQTITANAELGVCVGGGNMVHDKCIQVGTLQGGDGYTNFEANNRIYSADGLSPSIITRYNSDHATGFKVMESRTIGDKSMEEKGIKTIGNYSLSNHNASRVVDNDGLAPTVMENHGTVTATNVSNLRIRKLTPRECWRLQGFSDEAFDKAKAVNSDSQLYKQAGNSITVDVLVAILGKLLTDLEENK